MMATGVNNGQLDAHDIMKYYFENMVLCSRSMRQGDKNIEVYVLGKGYETSRIVVGG